MVVSDIQGDGLAFVAVAHDTTVRPKHEHSSSGASNVAVKMCCDVAPPQTRVFRRASTNSRVANDPRVRTRPLKTRDPRVRTRPPKTHDPPAYAADFSTLAKNRKEKKKISWCELFFLP